MNDFLFSGGEKFLFWLYKHFNKKLLKKYFPLNENDFQITLPNQSQIYINEQINHCNISFSILLKNYTNYDLFVSLIQIELTVNDYRFINFDKVLLKNFKRKDGIQFYFEIPITYYQVKKILEMFKHGNILNGKFDFNFLTRNVFGEKTFKKQSFVSVQVNYVPSA